MFTHRIFITGIYRSGTTLLSRILNNHSKLWVTYDSVHFMRFSYDKFSPIDRKENAKSLVKEVHDRIKRRWKMTFDLNGVLTQLSHHKKITYGYVYDLLMQALILRYKPEAIGWGEKTNVCWGQIPNFLKMFPRGKVIHLIRDPRDVMCSYREMTYEPGFAYLDSAFCSLDAFSKAKTYSRLYKNNYYVLKYENLIQNPRKEIKLISKFLDIDFKDSLLDVKSFVDKNGKWWTGESSFESQMRAISTKPLSRWKQKAKPFEIFFVEQLNKEYLEKYEYEQSHILLKKPERNKLLNILNHDSLIRQRYQHWQKTGEGVEAYPSDPRIK